eukprot:CAMPEP_0177788484 /NCGR_PEP_ID=MMETSP0491_2-20121128/22147_1 /TAXON_ID=63592 /ORGANISM="Tetraselmis chuii, Strain PLY429" /LENGTH=146 /DNA_ID=CAMNT_0019310097 /DNA_START=28 /DNA_END=468 /DNA_ORIENTATION=+
MLQGASSTEWYGFVGWVTSGVLYALFLMWAYCPESWLEAAGVTYIPRKYWALGLVTWLAAAVLFVFWAYESICMMTTAPLNALNTLHDSHSKWAADLDMEDDMCGCAHAIPPLVDIPITKVCDMLYGSHREGEETEALHGRGAPAT